MGVNICIADISLLIIVRAVVEVGLNLFFTYALLGNIGKKTFFCLIPIDLRHRFIFLALRHKGAEKRDDLTHELCGDLRQSWDKPSPDLRKIHYIVFGGDELALLHFAKLVDPAVAGGDQADDLIRFPRLFQGAESALVGGVALGLHLHLGLNIAAGVLLFRFFECFQKFTGTLDGLLHGNDRGTLGVLDLLANTAVFHAPGNALALLQMLVHQYGGSVIIAEQQLIQNLEMAGVIQLHSLADLAGKPREELPPVTDRKFLDIDIDNFNERMKAIAPRVAFAVPNTLTGEGQLMVDITLENMDDFSPAQIARKVDALNQLLEARTQLANLQTYMDGKAGAENLINKLLQDPTLLKALASAPKPVAQQESVLSGETGTAD